MIELTNDHQQKLLDATLQALLAACDGKQVDLSPILGEFGEHTVAGAFVTLRRQQHLRSCCGSFGQVMPLKEAIMTAAFRTINQDPRFPSICVNELPYLRTDIWLLDSPKIVTVPVKERLHEVNVGRHGLVIRKGNQTGLLLPSVATDYGWDAETFLKQTCVKAGLPETAWLDHESELQVFEGTSIRAELNDLITQTSLSQVHSFSQPINTDSLRFLTDETLRRFRQACHSREVVAPMEIIPPELQSYGLVMIFEIEGQCQKFRRIERLQSFSLSTAWNELLQLASDHSTYSINDLDKLRLNVLLLNNPMMHGTLDAFDLQGLSTSSEIGDDFNNAPNNSPRAFFLVNAREMMCLFNPQLSPESILHSLRKETPSEMHSRSMLWSFAATCSRSEMSKMIFSDCIPLNE